jgi:hypothetical protein
VSLLCAFFNRRLTLSLTLTLTLCVALLLFTNTLSECRVPPSSLKVGVAVNTSLVRTHVRTVDR